jgi:DNA-binding response OmpR family regulator
MISGMAENYDRRKDREAGADGFITKPFSLAELAEKVDGLLGSN